MHFLKCFLDSNPCIDLLLCDTGQLGAKWCELSIDCRLDICLIDRFDSFPFDVNDHDRELDDFLSRHWVLILVITTRALEIVYANVVEGCLVKVSLALKVEHHPEVLGRYAAILKALR